MTQWNFDNPGAGHVGSMHIAVGILDDIVDQLADLQARIQNEQTSGGLSATNWQGVAADTLRGRSDTLQTDLTAFASQVCTYADAIAAYASVVDAIRVDYAPIATSYSAAEKRLADGKLQSHISTLAGKASVGTSDYEESLDDLTADVGRIKRQIENLMERRRAADSTLAIVLGAVIPGSFRSIGHALVTDGVLTPDRLNTNVITRAMLDLTDTVLGGDGVDDQSMAALLALLGTDPLASAAYATELGGAKAAELLDMIGNALDDGAVTRDTVLDAVGALRHVLSIASATWDQAQARKFAAALVSASNNAESTIDLLFGDPDRDSMSETFTVAIADLMDKHAREPEADSPWSGLSVTGRGASALCRELALAPAGDRSNGGMSDAVFETLARYPQAALNWLTDQSCGDDSPRIDFWYGDAGGTAGKPSDSYEALSSLWSSIQNIDPYAEDVIGQSSALQMKLSEANKRIFDSLCSNANFLPENVSDTARLSLAETMAHLLPELALVPFEKKPDGDTSITSYLLDDGTTVLLPAVGQDQVVQLMSVIGGTTAGTALLKATVSSAQDVITGAALDGNTYNAREALNFAAKTQSLLDGAIEGAAAGITQREQEKIDELVSKLSTAISCIPYVGGPIETGVENIAERMAEKYGESLGEKLLANIAGETADQVDEVLLDKVINAGVSDWSGTSSAATGVFEQQGQPAALRASLRMWVIALAPAGVDLTNSQQIDKYVDSLMADSDELKKAYKLDAEGGS